MKDQNRFQLTRSDSCFRLRSSGISTKNLRSVVGTRVGCWLAICVWLSVVTFAFGGATTVRVYNYGIYPVTDVDVYINAVATCNYQNYCQPWFPYPCTNTTCGGAAICPGNTSSWTIAFNEGPCWNSGIMTLCNAETCPSGGDVTQDWVGGASEIQLRDDSSENQVYKCFVSGNPDGPDGGCPSSGCCGGMPVWSVSEPFVSLWLHDEPLGYQPSIGPRISLELAYKQREHTAGLNPNVFSFGKNWNFPWLSFVTMLGTNYMVHYPGGMEATLTGTNNYLNNTTLSGNTTNGFTILYPDGSQDIYGLVVTNTSGDFLSAYLTQRLTANSQAMTLNYHSYVPATFPIIRLESLVDGSGGTNLISYSTNNGYSTNLIIEVADPFGRAATMNYDSTGHLTNIVDVVGISSSLTYDTNDWPTAMTTPYGTTSFDITDSENSEIPPNGRSIVITQPDGGVQIYLCTNSAAGVPSSLSGGSVPNTSPFTNTFDTTDINLYNTFWWGPKQYIDLSTTNIGSFTAADFRKGRMKHWLQYATNWIGPTLSMQIDPSPDSAGSANGEITWYDYAGKTDTEFQGTQISPLFVANVLPDGTTSFTRTDRNSSGAIVTNINTYGVGSSVALRTNILTYAANQTDLLTETNALGIQVVSNAYNGYHEVILSYDALNEATAYTYDTNQRQTSVTSQTGLVTTNVYGGDGYLAEQAAIGVATNSYTYANGLVVTQTGPLGMTVTNTYDSLQRPTSSTYPDGTYTSNRYTYLDLTATKDRMGNWTYYGYDQLRRKIAETNALGNYTLYTYCLCGALETTRDALGNYTTNNYDNQVRLTSVDYPDGYSITYNLNLIGQTTNTVDSSGLSVTNWFSNQGMQFASSNTFGQIIKQSFDILDRLTNSVDQNGVVVATTYDSLNRMLTRTYPDGGVERYEYSAAGLVAYTSQLTNVTYYGYDPARRKIAETNALGNVTLYAYDEAGDNTAVTDQNGNTTTFGYDIYGRCTNKVDATGTTILEYQHDADNRLTNRWSLAKGNTAYSFDALGNLTNVTYPVSHSLSYSFDALSRMTSMADGVGTTTFSYTQVGQPASETGPWASDAVAYTYANRLRTSLALQQPHASVWVQSYGYDTANRLNSVASPAGTFTYSYNSGTGGLSAASTLISLLTLPNGAFITNTYDNNGRMLGTFLYNSGASALDSSVYVYNVGNQRTSVTRTGENTASYSYDPIGQLIADQASEVSGGAARLNEQLHYGFDAAGNLAYRTNNALIANFRVNSVNELTTNTNGGTLTVVGTTTSPANSVTVNSASASLYGDATFAASGLPLTTSYTATASDSYGRHSTNTVTVSLSTNVTFQYDGNGNLTNDGLRNFVYDDENELIQVSVSNAWMSQFSYDAKMRRRIRKEFTWTNTIWSLTNTVNYVYDGNLVVQERDANNLPTVTYTRGTDLSGSLEGAGGIGGLLSMTLNTGPGPSSSNSMYYHSDGNGNVTMLINPSRAVVAKYLYDAFGNLLSISGSMATVNPNRLAGKEWHDNSRLVYYLYRYYDPNLQRWLNRDPIGEKGGINLYAFVANDPICRFDYLGLSAARNAYFSVDNDTGHFSSEVFVAYYPQKNSQGCPACKTVKLAQIVMTIEEGAWNYLTSSQQWKLDTDGSHRPWYPYQGDNGDFVWLGDRPGSRWYHFLNLGQMLYGVTQTFETCAVCTDNGQKTILGCTGWGQSVGGLRGSSFWGSGSHKPPVPPSPEFLSLFH